MAVPRCDGIPIPNYQFHTYKKVIPLADGLSISFDPKILFTILTEYNLLNYYVVLSFLFESNTFILDFSLLDSYLVESNISKF